jgi:hypothetical protein
MSPGFMRISRVTVTDLPLITKPNVWVVFKGMNIYCDGSQVVHKYECTVRTEGNTQCVRTGGTARVMCLIEDG